VHPGHWDSSAHQEAINNALIHKHSLLAWYNQRNALFQPCEVAESLAQDHNKLWVASILDEEEGRTGLNLGCGSARYPGLINVDIRDGESAGVGGERFRQADPDIVADVEELPEGLSADFILASHIFEHVVDPIATLHDWMGRCQRLYLALPSHTRHNTMLMDAPHTHCYTAVSLTNLVTQCGYQLTALAETPHGHLHATVEHAQ
jgi:hypothetical protein